MIDSQVQNFPDPRLGAPRDHLSHSERHPRFFHHDFHKLMEMHVVMCCPVCFPFVEILNRAMIVEYYSRWSDDIDPYPSTTLHAPFYRA